MQIHQIAHVTLTTVTLHSPETFYDYTQNSNLSVLIAHYCLHCVSTRVYPLPFPEPKNTLLGIIFEARVFFGAKPRVSLSSIFGAKPRVSLSSRVPSLCYNCEIFRVNAMAFKFPQGGLNLFNSKISYITRT